MFGGGGGPELQSPFGVHSVPSLQHPVLNPEASKQQTGISEGQEWANSPVRHLTSAETKREDVDVDDESRKRKLMMI